MSRPDRVVPPETAPAGRSDATVVVCAYTQRRWDDLVAGVREARSQGPAAVLVVIDHEDELLARAIAELATADGVPVRVVPNARTRGLSGGRNTALDLATTEVVVFLDDDACPSPGWLEALLSPYSEPGVVAVGGAADPLWDTASGERPAHQARELDWVVGCSFTGQTTTLAEVRNVMGCNMSFRREVLVAAGGFDEGAGRVGTIPVGCEETEACIRIRHHVPGARIMMAPDSRVRHRVSPDRATWGYLRSRSVAEGLSKAWVAAQVGDGEATSVERAYASRVLPRGVLRELGRGLRGDRRGFTAAMGIVLALLWAAQGYAQARLGLRGAATSAADRARATPTDGAAGAGSDGGGS